MTIRFRNLMGLRRTTSAALVLMALVAIETERSETWATDDEAAITQIIKKTWERPDHAVAIAPIVLSGEYAVADWTSGEHGGRALLRRSESGWSVLLCSGDAIRTAEGLRAVGVPDADSVTLAARLATAEAALPAATLAKFSSFEGSVGVEDRPDGHKHHQH